MRLDSLRLDRSSMLGLSFLVLGVLLPTACVLWFTNEAMQAQVVAARQEVAESYRAQLRLLRGRVDELWRTTIAAIEVGDDSPGLEFARLVKEGHADSVIVADPNGAPLYPDTVLPALEVSTSSAAPLPAWARAQTLEREGRFAEAHAEFAAIARVTSLPVLEAVAAQAAIRCLLRLGDRAAAIASLETWFAPVKLVAGGDPQALAIAFDERLLLLELLPQDDARRDDVAAHLTAALNDYGIEMRSVQRLFLMTAVAAARAEAPAALFPTYEAERLALNVLHSSDDLDFGSGSLEVSRVPDVWKVVLPGSRSTALFRTSTVLERAAALLDESGAQFALIPLGQASPPDAIAAGPMLPGWQLAFQPLDAAAVEAASSSRSIYYLWVGGVVAASIALTGVLLLAVYRRQMQLAALKTDLVAAVSHELKTPLSSMRLLVDTLLEDGAAGERKTREYLELIARENARLSRLIESFLEFSRLERKREPIELAPTRPAEVAAAASAAVRERFELANCAFTVTIEPGLPVIHADRDALATALVNLLDNAFKYSNGRREISLSVARDGERVAFSVADAGIGIHARDQKRIFERFYQVDLSRETGGVGLGLSIVDLIARAHRGSIRVTSNLGRGSTFTLSIPTAAVRGLAA